LRWNFYQCGQYLAVLLKKLVKKQVEIMIVVLIYLIIFLFVVKRSKKAIFIQNKLYYFTETQLFQFFVIGKNVYFLRLKMAGYIQSSKGHKDITYEISVIIVMEVA